MKKLIVGMVVALCLILCSSCMAYARTIEEYKNAIQGNEYRIELVDNIKTQLHILADLLRGSDYVNNGFDAELSEKWFECDSYQNTKLSENEEIKTKISQLEQEQGKRQYVGDFKITHYCPCATCNGNWGNKTALGTTMTPYRTIAVDPKIIALGSKVEINGKTYIAEDTGGAIKGNRIDVCVGSHSEAYQKGVLYNIPVYIVK